MSLPARLYPVFLLMAALPACDSGEKDTDKSDETGDSAAPPEEGCILVNGGGGYAYLNDALALAADGDTIEVCAGEFEEAVVVQKPIRIVGAGQGQTIWRAPTNTAAFQIAKTQGVSIGGMTITSTRSGIEVDGATDVSLADFDFTLEGNYGVRAINSNGLTIENSIFADNQWGGVSVEGGSATVSDSVFTNNVAFAVKGDAADLRISGCQIDGTIYSEINDQGGVDDGFAVWGINGGSLELEGNTFTDNVILALMGDTVDSVSLSGDVITGGAYGVFGVFTDLTLQGVSIENPYLYGVYYVGQTAQSFQAEGLSVVGDPDVVADFTFAEIDESFKNDGVPPGSVGVLAIAPEISFKDTEITGYNDYGIFMTAYDSDAGGTATLENLTMQDNGRTGVRALYLDVTATNVSISGLRVTEPDSGSYVDYPAGFSSAYGPLSWTGGGVQDCAGWGIASIFDNITVQDAVFSGNTRSAIIDFSGTSYIGNSTFSATGAGSSYGTVWAYTSAGMVMEGNTFQDNLGESIQTYVSKPNTYTYVYHGVGLDIHVYNSAAVINGNTFVGGDDSIDVAAGEGTSEATITGNTWSSYTGRPVYVYSYKGSTDVTLEDNTVDAWGGYLVYCYSSGGPQPDVEISGLNATNGGLDYTSYDYYVNGKLSGSYSGGYAAQTLYGYDCNFLVQDMDVQGAVGPAGSFNNSVVEMEDVRFADMGAESLGSTLLSLSWNSSSTVEFYADGLNLEASPKSAYSGRGLFLSADSTASFGAVEVNDLEVSSTSSGLYLNFIEGGTWTSGVISDSSNIGVEVLNSTMAMEDFEVLGSGGDGLNAIRGDIEVVASTFSGNGGNGITLLQGSADIQDSLIEGNQSNGITATDATVSAYGNIVQDNGAWGLYCMGTVKAPICANEVTGNVAGDNLDCPVECVVPPIK